MLNVLDANFNVKCNDENVSVRKYTYKFLKPITTISLIRIHVTSYKQLPSTNYN